MEIGTDVWEAVAHHRRVRDNALYQFMGLVTLHTQRHIETQG